MKLLQGACHLLFILLISLGAYSMAESAPFIDEQYPETYQASFSSNTGKVTFDIDAVLEVPHVTDIPLYHASMRAFSPEEVLQLADILIPEHQSLYNDDGQWTDTTKYIAGKARYNDIVYLPKNAARTWDAYYDWGKDVSGSLCTIDDQLGYTFLHFAHTHLYNGVAYGSSDEGSDTLFEGNQIPGNSYTVAEAQAMADGLISQIAPELQLISVCSTTPYYVYPDEDLARSNDPNDPFTIDTSLMDYLCIPAYVFTYAREIDDILVTHTTTLCGSHSYAYAYMTDYERCAVTISNRGIESVKCRNPMQVGSMIQPSAQLLPFDDIVSVLKSVMPITYDAIYSNPNYDHITLTIDRITLGYMRTPVKGTPNAYQLIPVWDFFGTENMIYEGNPVLSPQKSPHISFFTINAMDGTVIERRYGY